MRRLRAGIAGFFAFVLAASSVPAFSGAEDTVDRMSLREKVGQLVMFAPSGTRLSAAERDAIRRLDLGGVILFAYNYRDRAQLIELTAQVQRAVRSGSRFAIGALISADQEGGVVKRFPDLPPWRSAPEIGSSGDPSIAYDQGRLTGRALHNVGVNVNLAPVADLDLPPAHVMRSRSFGSRPWRVGRLVRAFARGLQSKRTAAAVKHFPGLGGATVNSDDGRAYVYRTKRQLHQVDAVPFQLAIDGGARMVMLSHAMYVNDGGRRPASVSYYIATKRLRRELGFTGVSISDALGSVSWRFGGDTARACRATIRAGVSIALITGGVRAAGRCSRAIREGVRSGAIPGRRIDQAVVRVLRLKSWLGLYQG